MPVTAPAGRAAAVPLKAASWLGAITQLKAALQQPPPSTARDWAMPSAALLLVYASFSVLSHLDVALSAEAIKPRAFAHFFSTAVAVVVYGCLVSFVETGHSLPPSFSVPAWLSSPTGPTFLALLVSFCVGFVFAIAAIVRKIFPPPPVARPRTLSSEFGALPVENIPNVIHNDAEHLFSKLRGGMTHLEVLSTVVSTPTMVYRARRSLDAEKATRARREGDEGVLGPKWVQSRLLQLQQWPPKGLAASVFDKPKRLESDPEKEAEWLSGMFKHGLITSYTRPARPSNSPAPVLNDVESLDAPLQRSLMLLLTRLNSEQLNSDKELIAAAGAGKLDAAFFDAIPNFKNALEAMLYCCVQAAVKLRDARLLRTVVDCCFMVRVGFNSVDDAAVQKFQGLSRKEYQGCVPEMKVHSVTIRPEEGSQVITAGKNALISIEYERMHCDAFINTKVENCKAKGLDPNVELQSYREHWWLILTIVKKKTSVDHWGTGTEHAIVDEKEEFVCHFPIVLHDITIKRSTRALLFPAPDEPGTYTYQLDMKSEEFLGADGKAIVDGIVIVA